MSSTVIAAIISLSGILLSSLVSFFVSKSTTNAEWKKTIAEWRHAADLQQAENFGQMCAAVSSLRTTVSRASLNKAIAAVAVVRAVSSGKMADKLDELAHLLEKPINNAALSALLSEIIAENRKAKGKY